MNKTTILALIAGLCSTACYTTAGSRTEMTTDPVALAQSVVWTGIFWTTALIVAGIAAVAWAVAYVITERANANREIAASNAEAAEADANAAKYSNPPYTRHTEVGGTAA